METECIYKEDGTCCEDKFNCCDCGGNNCGCPYCWSCNTCEVCKGEREEE